MYIKYYFIMNKVMLLVIFQKEYSIKNFYFFNVIFELFIVIVALS